MLWKDRLKISLSSKEIGRLTYPQQKIWYLFYYKKLNQKKIARILNVSRPYICMTLKSCKKKLSYRIVYDDGHKEDQEIEYLNKYEKFPDE